MTQSCQYTKSCRAAPTNLAEYLLLLCFSRRDVQKQEIEERRENGGLVSVPDEKKRRGMILNQIVDQARHAVEMEYEYTHPPKVRSRADDRIQWDHEQDANDI